MHAVLTCEQCGERMKVARAITAPERLHVVCHFCEAPLSADVTAEALDEALTEAARRQRWAPIPVSSAWR